MGEPEPRVGIGPAAHEARTSRRGTPLRRYAGAMEPDPWRRARDLADLCELGARFVEGRLDRFPGWGAACTDDESVAVAQHLARVNRAGFLTVASQRGTRPGPGSDGRTERRRAFVAGFLADAGRLAPLADRGLRTWAFGARETGGDEFPVGERGGEAFLLAGGAAGPDELELFRPALGARALAALARTSFCWVVDPVWGRDRRLWQALEDVLLAGCDGDATRPPSVPYPPAHERPERA